MRKPNYRLNTDEVERLVREETERRRKLRIVQVREQAKANAALIRNKVKSEKERLLSQFAKEVKNELEAEKAEKLRKLEQKYDNTLRTVGQGHREVCVKGDGQYIASQLYREQQANRNVAEERFKHAIEKQTRDKAMQEWEETRQIRDRKLALEVERDRAATIAALPPPPPDISVELEKIQKKAIPMTDMKAFATTHYHIPDFQVIKARPEEQVYDAKELAMESDLRLKQDLTEKKRSHHEQIERARIRGNEALQREMLKHDLGDMLQDLSLLQRKDRRHRQAHVADIPKQVFIPPERCMEERADREIEMERKFEEIYLKQHKSDSGSSQAWSEIPSTVQESTEMSTSLESAPVAAGPLGKGSNPALRDVTNLSKSASGKEPETVLKQLLDKIKEQRNTVMASRKLPTTAATTSAIGMPPSESDAHSVLSAGSRASWKKTDDDDEQTPDSDCPQPGTQRKDDNLATYDIDEIDLAKESSSGMDGMTLSKTNGMIEELHQRIKMIEDQKKQLSGQLESQAEFYKKFQHLQQQQRPHFPDLTDSRDSFLEEVSLTSREAHNSRQSPTKQIANPPYEDMHGIDLPSAVANLRPIFGILKGSKNTNYELLTSNGFLPLSAMDGSISGDKDSSQLHGPTDEPGFSKEIFSYRQDDGLVAVKHEDRFKSCDRGARRMISFKDVPSRSMVSVGSSQILGRFESPELQHQMDCSDRLAHYTGLFDNTGSSLGQEGSIGKRMKEYQLRAQNLQESLDEGTLAKVREYQNRLLQTHEERKQFLSNVREDIERRREALYNTARFSAGIDSHITKQEVRVDKLSSTELKPITPFIADSWNSRSAVNKEDTVCEEGLNHMILRQEELGSSSNLTLRYGDTGNAALDLIRKSLPFDDLNDSNFETSPVNDILNDTATTRTPALSDDSKLLSSEEERGSPILTGSRSDRFDTSDKSNNSVTGSSSLNGSVLVARAEERREGFERRQEELRNQLTEIQDQKEAILQRYYHGQQALLQQQEALKEKLASSILTSQQDPVTDDLQHRAGLRGKLSYSKSQDTPDSILDEYREGVLYPTGAPTSELDSPREVTRTSWCGHLKPNQNDSDIKDGQNGFPSESYLDDISYHQIKETEEGPSSSSTQFKKLSYPSYSLNEEEIVINPFTSDTTRLASGIKDGVDAVRKDVECSRPTLHTWASVLLSSQSSQPKFMHRSDKDDFGTTPADITSGSKTPPPVSKLNVYEHQPHELSTILEVDTPSASSVLGSYVKATASSLSNPRLSHSSTLSLASRWDSDSRVDRFVDLPYTFPTSSLVTGTAYDLSSGSEFRFGIQGQRKGEKDEIFLTETSKAARSLHFHSPESGLRGSEEINPRVFYANPKISIDEISAPGSGRVTVEGDISSLQSQSLPVDLSLESRSLSPDYTENIEDLSHFESGPESNDRPIDVEVGEEELSSTAMPNLVGLTPIKPHQQEVIMSSVDLTGQDTKHV